MEDLISEWDVMKSSICIVEAILRFVNATRPSSSRESLDFFPFGPSGLKGSGDGDGNGEIDGYGKVMEMVMVMAMVMAKPMDDKTITGDCLTILCFFCLEVLPHHFNGFRGYVNFSS